MRVESAISLLKRVIHYTQEYNVADRSNIKNASIVVTYNGLEKHLNAHMSEDYIEMLNEFGELFTFLMKQGRSIANKNLDIKWGYNIIHGNAYKKDVNRRRQRFPPLIRPYFYNFNLFVLYQEPNVIQHCGTKEEHYVLTEKLSNEIQASYEKNSLPKEEYKIGENIKNFFNERFQDIFNEPELSVELLGTLHTKLALTGGFISMGIRLPQSYFREDSLLCDHTKWKDTVYDVHYLAKCLRQLGMEATLPIPLAKRTEFMHHISKIPCSIGVDDSFVFERDLLVSEYLKLDKRIKPLIVVILRFIKLQKINKSCFASTLSSYSYIFMILHFLMNVIEKPIIPNLQSQFDHCYSPDCNYNTEKSIVTTLFNNRIERVNIRYHTCVRVINKRTNIYSNDDNNYEGCTVWYSENDEDMGALFINFMDYYARRSNYKDISIVSNGSDYAGFKKKEVDKDEVWIQDPFVLRKNIARNCKFYPLKNIAKTFNSAAAKLKHGSSLQDICDMDTHVKTMLQTD